MRTRRRRSPHYDVPGGLAVLLGEARVTPQAPTPNLAAALVSSPAASGPDPRRPMGYPIAASPRRPIERSHTRIAGVLRHAIVDVVTCTRAKGTRGRDAGDRASGSLPTDADVVKALLVGVLAAWVKALSEPRLQRVAESLLPPSPAQKHEVGADPSGHPENMPPAVVVGRVASKLAHVRLTDEQRLRAQRVIHYSTGAGLGIAYSGAAMHWPAATRGGGAVAGLAIYAGTHGSALPALRIQRPPWRLAPAAVVWEATSHVIFGATLEAARRLITPLGER